MNLGEILERQTRAAEHRRRLIDLGGNAAREALLHLREGPWIGVSVQLASGGREIAAELATRLSWQLYDREILAEISRHDHVREEILARVERRPTGAVSDFLAHLLAGEPSRAAYTQNMVQVVSSLAHHGQAVFVGRAVNWFLDATYGLRVRVVAPLEHRARHLALAEKIEVTEARRKIVEHDEQRRDFVREVFDRDIDDPLGYDVLLNTERIQGPAAVELVRSGLHAKLRATD